jgi:hypothetical protein
MAHVEGFNGLHTVMPITPHAIAEGIRLGHNALGIDQAKPNTTLSGKDSAQCGSKAVILTQF